MPAAIVHSTNPTLPLEIVIQIIALVSTEYSSPQVTQKALRACTLVSRVWYAAAVGLLYECPYITGSNYENFVATICPSINAHIRKNGLAELVRSLDLCRLIHHGSRSLTARLLGRVKNNIEHFVAPQATFGINALAALSRCSKLRYLDLSLVSEQIPQPDLYRSLSMINGLEFLGYPRSRWADARTFLGTVPVGLKDLHVNGGLQDGLLLYAMNKRLSRQIEPLPLTRLTIGNCPKLSKDGVWAIVEHYSVNLEYLKIGNHMTSLRNDPLDGILEILGSLRHLSIPVDYITGFFFWGNWGKSKEDPYLLETIELDCIWPAGNQAEAINSDVIWDAVADGAFGRLRRVNLARRLEMPVVTGLGENSEELNQLLKALAREDGSQARYSEDQAGVRIFGSSAGLQSAYD